MHIYVCVFFFFCLVHCPHHNVAGGSQYAVVVSAVAAQVMSEVCVPCLYAPSISKRASYAYIYERKRHFFFT